jgi:hypothetical protein
LLHGKLLHDPSCGSRQTVQPAADRIDNGGLQDFANGIGHSLAAHSGDEFGQSLGRSG